MSNESEFLLSREKNVQGVGGWLLVFWLTLTAGVIRLAAGTIQQHHLMLKAIDLFSLLVGVMMLFLISIRSPLLFSALWVDGGNRLSVSIYQAIAALRVMQRTSGRNDAATMLMTQSLLSLLVVACWLVYFHRSKRVRATFGRNL